MLTIQVKTHDGRLLQIDSQNEGLVRAWLFDMVMSQGAYGLEITRTTVADASGSQPQRSLPA